MLQERNSASRQVNYQIKGITTGGARPDKSVLDVSFAQSLLYAAAAFTHTNQAGSVDHLSLIRPVKATAPERIYKV